MNVFIGTYDIAKILTGFKEGFTSIGCNVTTFTKEIHPFYSQQYDYVIARKFPNSYAIKNAPLKKIVEFTDYNIQNLRIRQKLNSFIEKHDVFIFIWQSLQKNFTDYKLIKAANKKIVTVFVGSEVRHILPFKQEFGGDLSSWEKDFYTEDLNSKIYRLRTAELYSDLILSVPDQAGLAIRPYNHLHLPLDVSKIAFNPVTNAPIKVIHAPSRSGAKGTAAISNAIQSLQSEGLKIEFKLIQNVTNEQLLEELKLADVLVDELYSHGPGMLGIEGMASGCAVATHTLNTYKNIFDPPVHNIDEKNIYEQLRFLFINDEYRRKLVHEGRRFVMEKNSPSAISKQILNSLNTENQKREYTPYFFTNSFKLPSGKEINKENLQLTKEVILKYNLAEGQDFKRAKDLNLI